MVDHVSDATRSRIMASVKSRNTAPELIVRRALHALGYRYRLHIQSLPGKPDLVFVAKRKIVFVHGCFWHGHKCKWGQLPKGRVEFWSNKILKNRSRDRKVTRQLIREGWEVHKVWQCELRKPEENLPRLLNFLGPPRSPLKK